MLRILWGWIGKLDHQEDFEFQCLDHDVFDRFRVRNTAGYSS